MYIYIYIYIYMIQVSYILNAFFQTYVPDVIGVDTFIRDSKYVLQVASSKRVSMAIVRDRVSGK